jgi:hypothetical protein
MNYKQIIESTNNQWRYKGGKAKVSGLNNDTFMTGDEFVVVKGYNGRPFSGNFGSKAFSSSHSVSQYAPGSHGKDIAIKNGSIIIFETYANNGNVWFYFDGERFSNQSGDLKNMLNSGIIKPYKFYDRKGNQLETPKQHGEE